MNYSLILTAGYANAILASEKKNQTYGLIAMSFAVSAGVTALGLLVLFFFDRVIIELLNVQAIGPWIYLIPLASLLLCVNLILSSFNVYRNRIKQDTIAVTSSNVINKAFNLIYGLGVSGNFIGLVGGDFVAKVSRSVLLLVGTLKAGLKDIRPFFSFKVFRHIGGQYRNYPKYVMPSTLLNALASHIPIYLFSIFYDSAEVGFFSFASTLLYIPVQLFGNSSTSIFLRKATEVYQTSGMQALTSITVKLYWNLLGLGMLCYFLVVLLGEVLFAFIFSSEWLTSGKYAVYLAIYHVLLLVYTPLNSIFSVLRKERLLLYANVIVFLSRVLSLGWGVYTTDAFSTVRIFCVVNLICFLALSIFVLKLVNASAGKHLFYTVTGLLAFLSIAYFLRSIIFQYGPGF